VKKTNKKLAKIKVIKLV